jgi:hypothetical protein
MIAYDTSSHLMQAISSALTTLLSILIASTLGGIAVIIAKAARTAISTTLFATTYVAGWSLRKPALQVVFTTGFVLAFAFETYEQFPKVSCMINALFDDNITLALSACIASAKS